MRFQGPTARPISAWGNAPGKGRYAVPRANGPRYTSLGQRPRKRVIMRFQGPTARPIPAWGNAPGKGRCAVPRANGPTHSSIPHIPLVVFHPVLLQKRQIFLLKTAGSMVLLLMIDISLQYPQVRGTYRERSVSPLPGELRQCRRLSLEPLRRRGLQLPYQIGDRQGAR